MNKQRCRTCQYCTSYGRANYTANQRNGWPRKSYHCTHPEINKIPHKEFGNKMPGFINFGDCTKESPVQTKTTPKWCPIKRKEVEEHEAIHTNK